MAAAPPSRVRWDRLGRVALLLVLAAIAYLYIGPTRSWISSYVEAREKREQVAVLKARHEQLLRRERELRDPRVLEQEARRLGWLKPGERAYVIEGLPGR